MLKEEILAEPVNDLARRLALMIDDELFAVMKLLERESEAPAPVNLEDILARIALTEDEIERRYPGQLLVPYRDWRERDETP